ncbi:Protein transport protein sft1 [Ceratocystis lukuohia]|uniref:Protein transport protein sft1 n=1 Tax=Ceratocystis lukuohia TaxID=2019550 RepID=A0ABR4MER6_9PEZI
MSEAYERERQNNERLNDLSAKVSALRSVTVDIYDHARSQDVIDSSLKGSATRLTRMAASGNKVAIFKLSGLIIAFFMILYYLSKMFF